MPRHLEEEIRFWLSVRSSRDGCWEWQGYTTVGYGRFRPQNKPATGAHRYSWLLHYGEIGPGFMVCHRCDNPRCVRPDHLFLGTHDDNMKDMVKKGRAKGGYRGGTSPGERNGHSKLTDQAVREIRVAAAAGVPKKELAKKYGVDPSAVSHMLRGKTWRHVTTDA